MFENKILNNLSLLVSIGCLILFGYFGFKSIQIANNQFLEVDGQTYVNQVRSDEYLFDIAKQKTNLCTDDLCKTQALLDFVSNIPYKINEHISHSPKQTIQNNFGDCDDKSNLLISLLHVLGIKSYFVLIPKHIFVIVALKDQRLKTTKGLYINDQKYYILETTAKNAPVGFGVKFDLSKINAVVDPFENKKIVLSKPIQYDF